MDVCDQAELVIEAEREAGVARVTAAVAGEGLDDCETCDDPIEAARRGAYPAARKCTACQEAAERRALQHRRV